MTDYKPVDEKERKKRDKAGAPLAKGVKGRQQALMNMSSMAREAAEYKTKVRANNPSKGKPNSNIVNRYSGNVTGSTSKDKKFNSSPKRVSEAKLNATRMLLESARGGNKRSINKASRKGLNVGGGMNLNFGEQIK